MELFGINGLQYIVLLTSMLLIFFIVRETELRAAVQSFSEMIQLLEQWINNPQDVEIAQHKKDINNHLKRLWVEKGLRFTLIRGDGIVLLDGAVHEHKNMANHLSRPEIQDALVNGRGVAMRKSETIGLPMIYVAEPFKTPWGTLYLRVSASTKTFRRSYMSYIMMLIVAITGVMLIKLC